MAATVYIILHVARPGTLHSTFYITMVSSGDSAHSSLLLSSERAAGATLLHSTWGSGAKHASYMLDTKPRYMLHMLQATMISRKKEEIYYG